MRFHVVLNEDDFVASLLWIIKSEKLLFKHAGSTP